MSKWLLSRVGVSMRPAIGFLLVFLALVSPVHADHAFDHFNLFADKPADSLLGGGGHRFLEPDQAFILSAEPADGEHIALQVEIAEGYYLYRDKFSFSIVSGAASLGKVQLPPGETKSDPLFGEVAIFTGSQRFLLPLQRQGDGVEAIKLQVAYQGCADKGICYPPQKKTLEVSLPASGGANDGPATAVTTVAGAGAMPGPAAMQSEQQSIAGMLAGSGGLLALLSFFGFGLLLSLTPCVFPMVPILSGLIVGQGHRITPRHAFMLSLVYVLAMALTYAVVGVLAGLFGKNLNATFQSPGVLIAFSAVFVLLALSMFGFYKLQLPAGWQARLSSISNHQDRGTYHGALIMGLLSALIVGPCVAPPLAGALIYIGQSGDGLLGGAALFLMGLGMGVPLLLIGASAGRWLPKAGVWMESVQRVFGVVMLGVAIWLLERILPEGITLLLWAVLLIISAIYMGALDGLDAVASGWKRLWKGVGLVMLIYGAVLIVGAASGRGDLLQPLRGMGPVHAGINGASEAAPVAGLRFQRIKGIAGLDQALARARALGRPVMLDFYADWCVECKNLERVTFRDPRVRQALGDAILLQADVTANDAIDQALLRKLGLIGPPAILFFDRMAREQRAYRLIGYIAPEDFSRHVQAVIGQCASVPC